jgi:hypothetical protein
MFFGCRNNFIALVKLALVQKGELRQRNERADDVEEISSYINTNLRL